MVSGGGCPGFPQRTNPMNPSPPDWTARASTRASGALGAAGLEDPGQQRERRQGEASGRGRPEVEVSHKQNPKGWLPICPPEGVNINPSHQFKGNLSHKQNPVSKWS